MALFKEGTLFRSIGDFFRDLPEELSEWLDDIDLSDIGEGIENNYTGNRDQENWQEEHGLAQDQFDYQKELNEKIMEREDTAIQRKVADMEAAGINPMAMFMGGGGSGASAAPLRVGGSRGGGSRTRGSGQLSAVVSLAQMDSQIALQKAHADLMNAQAGKVRQETTLAPGYFELESQRIAAAVREADSRILRNGEERELAHVRRWMTESEIDLNEARRAESEARRVLLAAETELTGVEADAARARILVMTAQVTHYESIVEEVGEKARRLQYDTDWYQRFNIPTNIGFDAAFRLMAATAANTLNALDDRERRLASELDQGKVQGEVQGFLREIHPQATGRMRVNEQGFAEFEVDLDGLGLQWFDISDARREGNQVMPAH